MPSSVPKYSGGPGAKPPALHHDMILTPKGLRAGCRLIPVSLGRSGVTLTKAEGDGATPAATLPILGLRYRPDRLPAARFAHLPRDFARPILPGDLWCDDPGHPAYNHPARAPFAPSHEALRRADPLYDLFWITGWNYPDATPGAGSAIFVHVWRRRGWPTAGCIAMALPDLMWLTDRLRPGARLIVPTALAQTKTRRKTGASGKV
ncbi:L,D-transpeptidase [Paracoccus sp. p4-l81]|uniref:L,D-transpeptidase family protein n=1 Tax=Paracoccus sp. p4-l81 TaxID=3342806 RepID=UPI0035BAF378